MKMEVKPELVEQDLMEKEDVRTMRELSLLADSICQDLKTTFDCPGLHEDGKMPLLDLTVWTQLVAKEGGKSEWEIVWEYYRKPCAARTVMLARSAMADRTKRSTLTQEAIRILRNCSLSVPWSRRAELLSDFSLRLKISGYSERFRETVMRSALSAWDKLLEADQSGEQPLYRERTWCRDKRNKQKEAKKKHWFRNLGGQTNDFTVFCPMSPGGKLAARWKKTLEQIRVSSGGRV